jgi:hypothetical protein
VSRGQLAIGDCTVAIELTIVDCRGLIWAQLQNAELNAIAETAIFN